MSSDNATLGQKHQQYNKRVKEAIATFKDNPMILEKIDYNESDLENLTRIDVANYYQRVDYILEVLKCDDIVYVKRAIKNSDWLITNEEHSHIICPEYLQHELFPLMTTKACNLFLLHIRKHLKAETRVDEFYKFTEKKHNIKAALKWLRHCSLELIEAAVSKYGEIINIKYLRHLLPKYSKVCKKLINSFGSFYIPPKTLRFIIHSYPDIYIHSNLRMTGKKFGKKQTNIIMNRHREIILQNIEWFFSHTQLDIPTLVKHFTQEDLKEFLEKRVDSFEPKYLYQYINLRHFMKAFPKEGRFEYIKEVFLDKTRNDTDNKYMLSTRIGEVVGYDVRWYTFAPFDVAFADLKELLKVNTPFYQERLDIFETLIHCSGTSNENIKALMEYFMTAHGNKRVKFKRMVVHEIVKQKKPHNFDQGTWNVLNTIFNSIGLFNNEASQKRTQIFIQCIIIYKIIHDETISAHLLKQFEFNSLQPWRPKLNGQEQEKVFSYVFNLYLNKIKCTKIESETTFDEVITFTENLMCIVNDWNRDTEYPIILEEIRRLVALKKEYQWNINLSRLYNINKSWRKHLFEESLFLDPSENVILNALKIDPGFLLRNQSHLKAVYCKNLRSLNRMFSKLRIFWFDTLAKNMIDFCTEMLVKSDKEIQAAIYGLFILLPPKDAIAAIDKYAHISKEGNCSKFVKTNIENVVRYLYLTRPQPPMEYVFKYTKNSKLNPSFSAMFYNINSIEFQEQIPKILELPIALQKYVIQLVYQKVPILKFRDIFCHIWNKTMFLDIRKFIFVKIFDLISSEYDPLAKDVIYEVITLLVQDMSENEDEFFLNEMCKFTKIPYHLKAKYCELCYECLNKVIDPKNLDKYQCNVVIEIIGIMEDINPDFVLNIAMKALEERLTLQYYPFPSLIAAYLLHVKDEEMQHQRFEQILMPILNVCLNFWNKPYEPNETNYVRENLYNLLISICGEFTNYVFVKNMLLPVSLFHKIQDVLDVSLSLNDNYILLRFWKLSTTFVRILGEFKSTLASVPGGVEYQKYHGYPKMQTECWQRLYQKASTEFGESCAEILIEDVAALSPCICKLFSRALREVFKCFRIEMAAKMKIWNCILEHENIRISNLPILRTVPDDDETAEETDSAVASERT